MSSWISADLVFYLLAVALGALGATLSNWNLHRRTYSLECSVSDLEAKLLIEIKRRAGHERQSQKSIDLDILNAAKAAAPVQPVLPWWQNVKTG
jgi:hypothetical protein